MVKPRHQFDRNFLSESGIKTWVGGNIGDPISEYLMREDKAEVLVIEVSSFMLEHAQKFNPKISYL